MFFAEFSDSMIIAKGKRGARRRTRTPKRPEVSPVTKAIIKTKESAKSKSSLF